MCPAPVLTGSDVPAGLIRCVNAVGTLVVSLVTAAGGPAAAAGGSASLGGPDLRLELPPFAAAGVYGVGLHTEGRQAILNEAASQKVCC